MDNSKTTGNDISPKRCKQLRIIGVSVSILILWNGVCDYIFAYSPHMSGAEYMSPAVWDLITTAGDRPHWMVMLAQTAGWLYPFYALSYFHWWNGMKKAGVWLATIPCAMLAYAILMIGGIQHAGFAFLSVLHQAKEAVGSADPVFYAKAADYILDHFVMGDLTALIALSLGPIWMAIGILSGRTLYPRWFVFMSPFGVLMIVMIIGYFLPAPYAGFLIALFGTWLMLIPSVASTIWLWNKGCKTA